MFSRSLPQISQRQVSQTKIFPAPQKGWIRNEPLAASKPGGAEVLDNIFPTAEGARLRKGSVKHATITAATTHLTVYDAGSASKLFAADEDKIYDVTSPASPSVAPASAVSGMTNGDWCSFQVATTGGEYLLMFNGADSHRVYDGTTWAANSPAITGVSSADVHYAWKWKSFVWLAEAETMDAYFLPAGTIGGAASVFPLGGVFTLGGSLLFGATWSQDSGSGFDDYCLFVTDKGEIAAYQGDDPSDADSFQLIGVYRIGLPLHKNAHFRDGGDLAIITDDGIVRVSAAAKYDRLGLKATALTYPIEEGWRIAVNDRAGGVVPFSCVTWPSETMLIVGLPTFSSLTPLAYVMNSRTGAWCRYVGWDVRCLVVFENNLYFGTADGEIFQGEVGGADDDVSYSGIWVPRFESFGRAEEKTAIHARIVARANTAFTPQLFANSDWSIEIPSPLSADTDESENAWDSGIWNTSTWGAGDIPKVAQSQWQAVAAFGHALSPGLQITTGRDTAPDVELIALHLQFELAGMMV